jgi:hypothetical protein
MTEDFPKQSPQDAGQEAIEAAVFRRLLQHLDSRKDVQNIDLMNLAGFCRNCLSKWYAQASSEAGVELDKEAAREIIYGMPYNEWKMHYQLEATPKQQAAFAAQQAGSSGE